MEAFALSEGGGDKIKHSRHHRGGGRGLCIVWGFIIIYLLFLIFLFFSLLLFFSYNSYYHRGGGGGCGVVWAGAYERFLFFKIIISIYNLATIEEEVEAFALSGEGQMNRFFFHFSIIFPIIIIFFLYNSVTTEEVEAFALSGVHQKNLFIIVSNTG